MLTFSAPGWSSGPLWVASSFVQRWRGLRGSPPDAGLVLRARSVHGIGLRRPLHVVFVDRFGVVLDARRLEPGGVVACRRARWAVELSTAIELPPIGQRLAVVPIVGPCPAFSFSAPHR